MSLKDFTDAYIECAAWSSHDGTDEWETAEFASSTLVEMQADCAAFHAGFFDLIDGNDMQAGHDFWLTRCGHGAGFWDGNWPEPAATLLTDASKACGGVDLYVGDDGMIYSPMERKTTMSDIHETLKLARAFGEQVQAAFSRAEFRRMLDMNKSSHSADGICATHDFCDANMLMHAAFVGTFGRDPSDGPDGMTEADCRLWSDAWSIAKAADFFA